MIQQAPAYIGGSARVLPGLPCRSAWCQPGRETDVPASRLLLRPAVGSAAVFPGMAVCQVRARRWSGAGACPRSGSRSWAPAASGAPRCSRPARPAAAGRAQRDVLAAARTGPRHERL